jgi:hypothetical protein
MSKELLEKLRYEVESSSLDFKRDQYPLLDDDSKSELIKDILAFANSWRRETAYILIGISEKQGRWDEAIGIQQHLQDSNLQQLVNLKLQNPIQFLYRAVEYDGKQFGIIEIPLQKRPFYLKRDFGKLRKNIVYIRQGSSTAEASPDEIASMGMNEVKELVNVEIFFTTKDEKKIESDEIILLGHDVKSNVPVQDYLDQVALSPFTMTNIDFFTIPLPKYFEYFQSAAKFASFRFGLLNLGDSSLSDMKIIAEISATADMFFCTEARLPEVPIPLGTSRSLQDLLSVKGKGPSIKKIDEIWSLTLKLDKLLAKESHVFEALYFAADVPVQFEMNVKIFGEEISDPIQKTIKFDYRMQQRVYRVSDLQGFASKRKKWDG